MRSSENKKKNTKTSIGTDAVRLTASKIITMCITMITSMLLSRFRTLEEYGTYSQILLVISLTSSIFMLGLPNSINYFLARAETREERKKFLSVYYSLSTLLCIIMGAVLVCATPLLTSYFKNPKIESFLYFIAVFPWANVISSNIENILVVYKKTHFLMVYRIVNSVCLLGTLLITQLLHWGFAEYMMIFLVVNCVFAVSVYIISARLSGGLKICFNKKIIKAILVFSLPLGLASVVGTLNIEIDKLLIGWMMDTEQLAIYTNASKELPVTIIASSITAVLLPRMAVLLKKKKAADAVKLWNSATELSFMFMMLFVAGLFTYAEDVMTILYSDKYLPGITVFRVYLLVLLLRITYFGIILNANGQTKKILWCSIASLVFNIVLNPLLYSIMGIVGPAVATFLAILIITVLQLILTSKAVKISFKDIFPWKRCFPILLINVVCAVIFSLIKKFLPLDLYITGIGESLVLGGVWAAFYLFVMKKRIKKVWQELNTPLEDWCNEFD